MIAIIELNFVHIPSLHQYRTITYEKKSEYIIIIIHTTADRAVIIINFLATYDQFHMSVLIPELYDLLDV